jgi:HPt (histidine-containing phosphotransfer) domain-containing protein
MDDEDYRMIVEMFIDRLRKQIPEFRTRLDAGNYQELADLAHWLKGSGGTAGFECFTESAKLLQEAAEAEDSDESNALLTQIEALVNRVSIGSSSTPQAPAPEVGNSLEPENLSVEPLTSSLPMDDEDYRMIVEMFIDRLRKQMPDFRNKFEEGDYQELANLAHWLKGSGGTAGFECFTEPAKLLQEAAEAVNSGQSSLLLTQIEGLVARVSMASTAP